MMKKILILDLNEQGKEFIRQNDNTYQCYVLENDLLKIRYKNLEKLSCNYELISLDIALKMYFDKIILFPYYEYEFVNKEYIKNICEIFNYNLKDEIPKKEIKNIIKQINVATIFVGSIYGNIRTFETGYGLHNYFLSENINSIYFSSNNFEDIEKNVYSLKEILLLKVDIFEKYCKIRDYIYETIYKKNPDIIIINIPDELSNVDEFMIGEYGLKYFMFYNFIHPDYSILNIFINDFEENALKQLLININNRAFSSIDLFCLTDYFYENHNEFENDNSNFFSVNTNIMDDKLLEYKNIRLDNICLYNDYKTICNKIKEKLWKEK